METTRTRRIGSMTFGLTLFTMCMAGADIVLEGVRKGIEVT